MSGGVGADRMIKVMRYVLVLAVVLSCGALTAGAEPANYEGTTVYADGFSNPGNLNDGNRTTVAYSGAQNRVTLSREDGIAAVYIEFDRVPEPWTVTASVCDKALKCGENGFLHEYVDLSGLNNELPREAVLTFKEGTAVGEIYAFSEGEVPDWVQVWQPPCKEADLLLISSHSDDEQLFFAGVLPYYAVERKLNVQVAYLVQHFEANGVSDHRRPHEQLDGLWTVGVRNYPVMSGFPDLYSESSDREEALKQALSVYEAQGYTYQDFVDYLSRCLRRFRPLVVVSHDLDGEYGHGTHVLCAEALGDALAKAADPSWNSGTGENNEVWQVEKTYLHLYPDNRIVMDWDTPLESLDGKTPFQVTKEGFGCHKSQHWTWFYRWIYGTGANPIGKASDIKTYSPCLYGLYDTKVGQDSAGGDFFENVRTYAQRAQDEAERLAEEKAEQERQERLAREKAELEAKRLETEKAKSMRCMLIVIVTAAAAAVLCGFFVCRHMRRRHGK